MILVARKLWLPSLVPIPADAARPADQDIILYRCAGKNRPGGNPVSANSRAAAAGVLLDSVRPEARPWTQTRCRLPAGCGQARAALPSPSGATNTQAQSADDRTTISSEPDSMGSFGSTIQGHWAEARRSLGREGGRAPKLSQTRTPSVFMSSSEPLSHRRSARRKNPLRPRSERVFRRLTSIVSCDADAEE